PWEDKTGAVEKIDTVSTEGRQKTRPAPAMSGGQGGCFVQRKIDPLRFLWFGIPAAQGALYSKTKQPMAVKSRVAWTFLATVLCDFYNPPPPGGERPFVHARQGYERSSRRS
ncbi:MAG: hypothetical protein NZM29_02055, partial [Nitrospira sp.]|nr:hypothetical protein [Nitrospira sp.]